jgi:hypothetical protein
LKNSNIIYQKIEDFIKKFYINELIRGFIFFIGLGLLYFLFTLFVEYFLWLKPIGRTFLFLFFVSFELFFLVRFILFPVFKLLKLQKGIDYQQASKIIGTHFTEVQDTLLNFIQLSDSSNHSELLIASIEQKSNSLQPIPFGNAINFKNNNKFLPLAIVPILVFLFLFLSGNSNFVSQSLNRVVHFNAVFLPPAPFEFLILNSNLQVEQNKDFVLRVQSSGKVVPENVLIVIGSESYFMESSKAGVFQFKFNKPTANFTFHLEANSVISPDYEFKVITVPSIAEFDMLLQFPSYLKKKNEIIKGTGNAIIPEGTLVTWKLVTQATNAVDWFDSKSRFSFVASKNSFVLSKKITQNTEYQIITGNNLIKNYENLNYQLSVVKDQFPSIQVGNAPDSLKVDKSFVLGQITDDIGFSKLQIVYYEKGHPHVVKRGTLGIKSGHFDQFVFSFPSNLPIVKGVLYEYYFEVFDNDLIHNFKSTKSSVFSSKVNTDSENENILLQQQNENINSLEKSIHNQVKQITALEKIQKTGKEKNNLEFKDQQNVNDFIQRQKQQDDLMKEFTKKMNDNLDKLKSTSKDLEKEELQKRIEKAEKDLEENNKLLDELKNLNDKIKNEELQEKLEKFKQNSKTQTKNLEQLVELTKRFYVEKKAEQLVKKLEDLSAKQDKVFDSNKENNEIKQKEINKEFDQIQEDLSNLKKDNKDLKKPLDIPNDSVLEKNTQDDLNKATEELKKNNLEKAKSKQKGASNKMKALAQNMKGSLSESDKEQIEEDVKMLRQILDNLLAFSLSQEEVLLQFRTIKTGSPSFNKNLKNQQDLKLQFKHIDDSLFTLSLRNAKIAEDVIKEVAKVHYNIDKSLDNLSNAQLPKGISHQQYSISSANRLADMLSETLSNLQLSISSMSSGGKPKPGNNPGMQLPDIIKKQQSLADKMKEGLKKGEKPGDKSGDKPGQNKSNSNGKESKKDADVEGSDGEGNAKAIMDIYREQKQLREALENELKKQGIGGLGINALSQIKAIEKQLINKGFKNETLQKMFIIKQELLKLETAIQEQGQDNKRQSEIGKDVFKSNRNTLSPDVIEYLNSIEILNRQSLPLRSNFNQKVQQYFNK